MAKTLHNILNLINERIVEVMPTAAQKNLQTSSAYFEKNQFDLSAKSIIHATEILLQQLYSCTKPGDTLEFNEGWEQSLAQLKSCTPEVSTELVTRLELINSLYITRLVNSKWNISLNELEYLIVSCVDIYERAVTHRQYNPETLT